MPSASAITLTDSTAGTKIFNPLSVTPSLSVFINRDANSAAASEKIQLAFKPATTQRPTDHCDLREDFPLEALVDGKYIVTDTAIAKLSMVIPSSFQKINRKDFLSQFRSLVNSAEFTALVEELEAPY